MANTNFTGRFKQKRDTAINWRTRNPILLDGEIAIVRVSATDIRIKVGDGKTKYNDLPFVDETLRVRLENKVDKDGTKVLSTNDFTNTDKEKLDTVEEFANNYVLPDATTEQVGGVKLVDSTNSTSVSTAATPHSVKLAYDKGAEALAAAEDAQVSADQARELAASKATLAEVMTRVDQGYATKGEAEAISNSLGAYENEANQKIADVKAIAEAKQSPATTLAGYGIGDAYTKEEIEGLLVSVMHYKGTKNTFEDLPTNPQVGDVWNIATATLGIPAGANVAWDGAKWDVLPGEIDLSAYTPTADLAAVALSGNYSDLNGVITKVSELDNDSGYLVAENIKDKVDKVEGKQLSTNDFTDELKATVEDIKDKVDNEGKQLSTNDFTDELRATVESAVLSVNSIKPVEGNVTIEASDISYEDSDVASALETLNRLAVNHQTNVDYDYLTGIEVPEGTAAVKFVKLVTTAEDINTIPIGFKVSKDDKSMQRDFSASFIKTLKDIGCDNNSYTIDFEKQYIIVSDNYYYDPESGELYGNGGAIIEDDNHHVLKTHAFPSSIVAVEPGWNIEILTETEINGAVELSLRYMSLNNENIDTTFTLPVATDEVLGGVKTPKKSENMTVPVGVDEDGALWVQPGAGTFASTVNDEGVLHMALLSGDGESASISKNIMYAVSEQGINPPTAGWTTTIPNAQGKYLWTRMETDLSNNTKYYAYAVSYQNKEKIDATEISYNDETVASALDTAIESLDGLLQEGGTIEGLDSRIGDNAREIETIKSYKAADIGTNEEEVSIQDKLDGAVYDGDVDTEFIINRLGYTPASSTALTNLSNRKYLNVSSANGGTAGYLKLASLQLGGTYANVPIQFLVCRRGDAYPTYLNLMFVSQNTNDPPLSSFTYSGASSAFYIHKSATSTWDLWAMKSEGYDNITVLDCWSTSYNNITITWKNEFSASAISGWTQATAVNSYYTATTGASWSGSAAPYSIAVTVSGLTTSDHPIVWLNPSTTYSTAASQANAWKYIYRVAVTAANTLTLYSSVKSNIALPIQMVVVRK